MNFKELFEGAEPKLPGAPSGIKVMTPQQFVAKNEPEEEISEDVGGNYLYHSTENADTAKKILSSGFLKAGNSAQDATDAQVGETPTISFGRNLNYQTTGGGVGRDYQVVFVIDRDALENRYKTIGTSQSSVVKGLGFGTGVRAGSQQNQDASLRNMYKKRIDFQKSYLDKNKDGELSKDEIAQDPEIYNRYFKTKAGKEFEEVVPVKTGKLPLQNILVGFYLVPGKAASKDPELINHPLRLDMPRPNTFVKANKETVSEDLRKWFKEKWVRFGPDGKIRGACARGDDSEGKPKCLPQAKAHALGKKGRKYAAAKKRREDPNPERRGPAKNVATKKKTDEQQLDEKCWDTHKQVGMKSKGGKMVPNCVPKESVEEGHQQCPECGGPMFSSMLLAEKKDACYYKVKSRYKVWPSAYASGALVKCRKKGASNWGTKSEDIEEATKLAAPTRPIGDPELTDYLDRIRTQQKKKTDKYKLPYIHRSSVVGYYSEDGKKYNVDAIKAALKERPKALLKKNEKMKHSDGEQEQFFNIGFAALVGIALDENTNELIIVNTCPGAGSCKVDCFAMKGGKVQFQGPWLSDGRILTYLLNDPEGFFNQLKADITKEAMKGKKGGYKVSIRWHDAGDFFSPEYASMAFKLAESLPEVDFYAYTKVAGVALGDKPKNFMINWSEGASASQEKQVKGADSDLSKTKNSRIVPTSLFYDLLVKDEKKNLVKGPEGQWQVIPDKLPELKQRLAKEYGLSANSILSYSEWESKAKGKDKSPLKYNVIITPGEPDLTAKDAGVLSTLLLKH